MRVAGRKGPLIAAAIVWIGMPGGAVFAQRGATSTLITGVADAETGAAIEGAEVVLTQIFRVERTNALGEATMRGVPHGTQRMRVRRLGYVPAEIDLALVGDTTGAVFRLQRAPTRLGAVTVEADWIPPKMREVDMRRRQGNGRFLTEVDLERDKDALLATAMAMRFLASPVSVIARATDIW